MGLKIFWDDLTEDAKCSILESLNMTEADFRAEMLSKGTDIDDDEIAVGMVL